MHNKVLSGWKLKWSKYTVLSFVTLSLTDSFLIRNAASLFARMFLLRHSQSLSSHNSKHFTVSILNITKDLATN
jgi:hypothetical protein